MPTTWKGISGLDIRLESGLREGAIYANSRHQAAVVISVIPTNGGQPVEITKQQLDDSLILVDYVTGKKLNTDGWKYSKEPNEFHRLEAVDGPHTFAANINGLYQTMRYITCDPDTTLRTRSIGVQIKPPDGTTTFNSSQNGAKLSKVVLSTYDEIHYKRDTNVRMLYINIPREDERIQTNCYLSASTTANNLEHHFIKAKVTPSGEDKPFFIYASKDLYKVAWAWPFGAQAITKGRLKVVYNERPWEVCVSLLKGSFFYDGTQAATPPKASIVVTDQYGNKGTFRVFPTNWPGTSEYGDGIEYLDGSI